MAETHRLSDQFAPATSCTRNSVTIEICLPKKSLFFVNLSLSLVYLYTSDVMEEGKH